MKEDNQVEDSGEKIVQMDFFWKRKYTSGGMVVPHDKHFGQSSL